jgi:6-phosphofructokinase 1
MSTLLGYAAVEEVLAAAPESESQLIGMKENRITKSPLMPCVEQTHAIAGVIAAQDYEKAMEMRGGSFKEAFETFRTLAQALPRPPQPAQKRLRLAVMNAGGLAPGMNTAVRAVVRLGINQGHEMIGVQKGFQGLIEGDLVAMDWMSVGGWGTMGGSELGTNRKVPEGSDFYAIARHLESHNIQGLLIIGGWAGYEGAYRLHYERDNFPAFNIPIVCLPASIDNNLPGSELSIGADTALNNIVEAVDKIKQSAVATRRCFVVEVMGRYCGYLALMSGLATGAEQVYLHEEGVTLRDLQADVDRLTHAFQQGRRVGLMIRNEDVNPFYTIGFMCALFEEEGGDLFDVRQAILGHLQQGGDPSPFDRIQATRLAVKCIDYLIEQASQTLNNSAFVGLQEGQLQFLPLEDWPRLIDVEFQRPKTQWWLSLRPIAKMLAQARRLS